MPPVKAHRNRGNDSQSEEAHLGGFLRIGTFIKLEFYRDKRGINLFSYVEKAELGRGSAYRNLMFRGA